MLQPKRTKFRKMQKGRVRGLAHRGSTVAYGSFAIKTLEVGFITSRQIEAARIAINRYMKREGKVWIRIFPTSPSHRSLLRFVWVRVRVPQPLGGARSPGRIMFEVDGVPMETAQEALRRELRSFP